MYVWLYLFDERFMMCIAIVRRANKHARACEGEWAMQTGHGSLINKHDNKHGPRGTWHLWPGAFKKCFDLEGRKQPRGKNHIPPGWDFLFFKKRSNAMMLNRFTVQCAINNVQHVSVYVYRYSLLMSTSVLRFWFCYDFDDRFRFYIFFVLLFYHFIR